MADKQHWLSQPSKPAMAHRHRPIVDYDMTTNDGGLQIRTTKAVRDKSKNGGIPDFLFKLNTQNDRWEQVADEQVVDLTGETPKLYALTVEEVSGLVGRHVLKGLLNDSVMTMVNAYLHIRMSVNENPNLSPKEKHHVMQMLKADFAAVTEPSGKQLSAIERSVFDAKATHCLEGALRDKPLILQRPTGTVFHKAQEAFRNQRMSMPLARDDARDLPRIMAAALSDAHQIFVVEHNWASAFAHAKDFDGGEFRLPAEICAFEFQVNNLRVVLSMSQLPETDADKKQYGIDIACILNIQTAAGWIMPGCFEFRDGRFLCPPVYQSSRKFEDQPLTKLVRPLLDMLAAQIRAVSISLEAKVAEREVVRAPYKLNAKREKKGQLPLRDYHIVSLARRASRPIPMDRAPGAEPSHRKRLHWRRGHWRHYEDHKVWIEWNLVGNPDLDFIDKHYRL